MLFLEIECWLWIELSQELGKKAQNGIFILLLLTICGIVLEIDLMDEPRGQGFKGGSWLTVGIAEKGIAEEL